MNNITDGHVAILKDVGGEVIGYTDPAGKVYTRDLLPSKPLIRNGEGSLVVNPDHIKLLAAARRQGIDSITDPANWTDPTDTRFHLVASWTRRDASGHNTDAVHSSRRPLPENTSLADAELAGLEWHRQLSAAWQWRRVTGLVVTLRASRHRSHRGELMATIESPPTGGPAVLNREPSHA